MVYFCADDYGIAEVSNIRIENCIKNRKIKLKAMIHPETATDSQKWGRINRR